MRLGSAGLALAVLALLVPWRLGAAGLPYVSEFHESLWGIHSLADDPLVPQTFSNDWQAHSTYYDVDFVGQVMTSPSNPPHADIQLNATNSLRAGDGFVAMGSPTALARIIYFWSPQPSGGTPPAGVLIPVIVHVRAQADAFGSVSVAHAVVNAGGKGFDIWAYPGGPSSAAFADVVVLFMEPGAVSGASIWVEGTVGAVPGEPTASVQVVADPLVYIDPTFPYASQFDLVFSDGMNAEPAFHGCMVTYLHGENGSIAGADPQDIPPGGSTTAVRAVPQPGYRFVRWSDGSTANPRTDTGVTTHITVTAEFAAEGYTVTFQAGPNGALAGAAFQYVVPGGSTAPVTAVADPEFVFSQWTDGATDNPRVLSNVTSDLTLAAVFVEASPVAADGTFAARVSAAGRELWDLTGAYATAVAGSPLVLNLIHDTKGRLTGTATYTVGALEARLPIRGTVRGGAGAVVATIALHGEDSTKTVAVTLRLSLAVDRATQRLVGPASGSIKVAGVGLPVDSGLAFDLPASMDGTWTLTFQLSQARRGITGSALLALSNGVSCAYALSGQASGATALLSLTGTPADLRAKGGTLRTRLVRLEGGWARLQTFAGKGYGQTIVW